MLRWHVCTALKQRNTPKPQHSHHRASLVFSFYHASPPLTHLSSSRGLVPHVGVGWRFFFENWGFFFTDLLDFLMFDWCTFILTVSIAAWRSLVMGFFERSWSILLCAVGGELNCIVYVFITRNTHTLNKWANTYFGEKYIKDKFKFEVLTDIVKHYWNPLFPNVLYVCSKWHFFIWETMWKLALRVAKQQLLHLAVYSLSYNIYPPITVMTGLFPVSCFRWCLTNSSPAGKIVNGAFENSQGRARHIPLAEAHLCDSTEPENMSKCLWELVHPW